MRFRLLSFALALGLVSTLIAAPLAANAAPPTSHNPAANLPMTGTTTTGGTFAGTLQVTHFAVQGGNLVANGLLSGTLTDSSLPGGSQTVTNVPVTLPVTLDPTCTILDLTLGPLHLNLLGLIVDLNQVHLTITAQSGNGNLLGNLLCAIANLLNGNPPLTGLNSGLAALLNQVLAAL